MHAPDEATVRSFGRNGYAIFPKLLEVHEVALLRSVCDELLAEPPDDDLGGTAHDIGRGHDRRFLRHRHREFPALCDFLLGTEMKRFVRRFVGETPYLFNEQFVVKGPKTGAAFAWHQDGGYVGFDHRNYLTVWMAVDDTTAENGPVYVLPRDLTKDSALFPHHWDRDGKEMIGYDGADEGVAAIVPAGSVVAFSSATLHRSSPNTTDRARRAFIAQFSPEPIIDPATGQPKRFATAL